MISTAMKRHMGYFRNILPAAAAAGFIAVSLVAMPPVPASAAARVIKLSADERVGRLQVVAGRSETLRVSLPFTEIVVGDPETADVNPLSDRTLYVLGKKLGTTNVTLFDEAKQIVAVIDIEVTQDLVGLREALKQMQGGAGIKVRSINGRVLIEGVVASAPTAARALAIAKEFTGDSVSSSLSIADNQQVNLEVRFVEVSREAGKDLGVSWNMVSKGGEGFVSGNTPPGFGTVTGFLPFGSIVANILSNGTSPDLLINALEQRKVARRLAEPNLTALSGQSASFHAGGEIPIRTCNTEGTNANTLNCEVTYKEFGVKLEFLPTVLDDGLINLSISPEVSEINQTLKVGENFSFVTRKAKTSVELRDGQSFAIAGLLQSNNTRSKDQVPWLGDVPVLGTLFRSSSFQKRESDLVIIVTPRLVRPVGTKQQLKTPFDNTLSSNEPELFLLGKQEVSRKQLDIKYNGVYGHIIDLPKVNYGSPQK
jgi:pilus assembly protein CpaC